MFYSHLFDFSKENYNDIFQFFAFFNPVFFLKLFSSASFRIKSQTCYGHLTAKQQIKLLCAMHSWKYLPHAHELGEIMYLYSILLYPWIRNWFRCMAKVRATHILCIDVYYFYTIYENLFLLSCAVIKNSKWRCGFVVYSAQYHFSCSCSFRSPVRSHFIKILLRFFFAIKSKIQCSIWNREKTSSKVFQKWSKNVCKIPFSLYMGNCIFL